MRVVLDGVAHYKCSWCRRDFSREGAPHISLQIGERSGVVSLNGPLPGWGFDRWFRPQGWHFCLPPDDGRPSCSDQFFRAIAVGTPPPEYVS